MKRICVFMLCASVSFSVVVISCATYEKMLSVAYALRVSADYQMFLMGLVAPTGTKVSRSEA
jgi:hypothetical protein